MFSKVLVANRGEIAVRIFRTLRDLGVRSVAVYSEADRQALFVDEADEAYLLGPAPAAESYLRIDKIVEVAKESGVDAIHPGYGFLSENAEFAQAVGDAGITWIGPPPAAIEVMGDKVEARRTAREANVPIVAGTPDPVDADGARAFADEHGYPVAVKAVMGGGGKAFRVARSAEELDEAVEGAAREAQSYFGNPALFCERYVDRPRHVEAQILADDSGTVAFIGERDCSTQRRHQKLIEEAPSPAVTPELREQIAEAATSLAKTVGYRNAGTVEFILSPEGELSFLEMNTRLQVEHPVSELVCGVDIVAEQIRIAAGEPLGYEFLEPRGAAIECRINAEDPLQGFLPSPGPITRWDEPAGPFIRVDHGFVAGRTVPEAYDSLVAKLVCFGSDREEARGRLLRALEDFRIEGVTTTIPFHRAFCAHEVFRDGEVYTRFVEDEFMSQLPELIEALPEVRERPNLTGGGTADAVASLERRLDVEIGGRRYDVSVVERSGRRFTPFERSAGGGGAEGEDEIRAPMQGTILKVMVEEGDQVSSGDLLCTLEAMKMENHVLAPRAGVVSALHVEAGSTVETNDIVAVVDATE